jgi:hypothetical protein
MTDYFDIPESDLSHFKILKCVSYRENCGFNFCNNPLKDGEIPLDYFHRISGEVLGLQFSYKVTV